MKHFAFGILFTLLMIEASGRILYELEPNDDPNHPYDPGVLQQGDLLRGQVRTANPSDVDHWRLRTGPNATGIYENRLRYDGVQSRFWAGGLATLNAMNVHGLGQSMFALGPQDHVFARWYTFGETASVMMGLSTQAAGILPEYSMLYEQVAIAPEHLGSYAPGTFRLRDPIGSVSHTSILTLRNHEHQVNELSSGQGSRGFDLEANLEPGIYTFGLAYGRQYSDTPNPELVIDGSKAVFNGGTSRMQLNEVGPVEFFAGSTSLQLDYVPRVQESGTHTIAWYSFEVVPEPGVVFGVGAGVVGLLARRRAPRVF